MSFFANLLPRQVSPIPWGWENKTVEDPLCGQTTYVSKPLGEIRMPSLCEHFDWSTFIIEEHSRGKLLGTRNFKSIFTTAARFLGYEELLSRKPWLSEITAGFLEWNKQLLKCFPHALHWFLIGDDIAGNLGPMLAPWLYEHWLMPEQEKLVRFAKDNHMRVALHTDGDVKVLLPLFASMEIDALVYEPVGAMKDLQQADFRFELKLVEDQSQRHENSMRMQR